uniref:Uncharacterized protein n=1 Tax=Oryza nivara TaxID=4536 RepID=A0A0E0HXI3_ORYNI
MAAILRSLGRSATTAGLFGRRCRLLSEAASDHQRPHEEGICFGDDAAGKGLRNRGGRIIRLSIITYASFKLGQNSARNAYKRTKAELPCLEDVDSTTA